MSRRIQLETPLTPALNARFEQCTANPETPDETWKSLGNDCFAHGSYLTAIKCYSKVIERPNGDSAVLRSNRSAAYLKSSMFSGFVMALKDAERASELDPTWFKAYLRVGDAQFARKKYGEAQKAYTRALALNSTCETAKASLDALKVFMRDEEKREPVELTRESTMTGENPYEGGKRPPLPVFHNAELGDEDDPTGRRRPPTEEETARLIRAWREEQVGWEDNRRTAMVPRTINLDTVDREAGSAYKEKLLSTFRAKVDTTEALGATLRQRQETEMLKGDGVNYREPERYRTQYAQATNGIGLGISADSYREFTGTKISNW